MSLSVTSIININCAGVPAAQLVRGLTRLRGEELSSSPCPVSASFVK